MKLNTLIKSSNVNKLLISFEYAKRQLIKWEKENPDVDPFIQINIWPLKKRDRSNGLWREKDDRMVKVEDDTPMKVKMKEIKTKTTRRYHVIEPDYKENDPVYNHYNNEGSIKIKRHRDVKVVDEVELDLDYAPLDFDVNGSITFMKEPKIIDSLIVNNKITRYSVVEEIKNTELYIHDEKKTQISYILVNQPELMTKIIETYQTKDLIDLSFNLIRLFTNFKTSILDYNSIIGQKLLHEKNEHVRSILELCILKMENDELRSQINNLNDIEFKDVKSDSVNETKINRSIMSYLDAIWDSEDENTNDELEDKNESEIDDGDDYDND